MAKKSAAAALNTFEKVDALQRDIDNLKQKIVSNKAQKLKKEIANLKNQLKSYGAK